jgi:hypothetical protein
MHIGNQCSGGIRRRDERERVVGSEKSASQVPVTRMVPYCGKTQRDVFFSHTVTKHLRQTE